MNPLLVWTLSVVLAVLTALLVVLSAMLERPGPIRLRHCVEEAGGRLRLLWDRPERFEAFRYLLSALARAMPVALIVPLAFALAAGEPLGLRELGAAMGIAAALVVAVELLNRFLVSRNPEKVLRRLTLVYRGLLVVLWPLVLLTAPLLPAAAVQRRDDVEEDEASEEEIEAFLDVGATEGILEPGEEDLILRVIDFGDDLVRSVMTPRVDVIFASVDTSLDKLAQLIIDSKHSRIPLYGESVEDIRGVLHIRDLLRGLRSEGVVSAASLALPPVFVPETKRLADLLRDLQAAHQQMAIVVDEYGGTAGVVTVEDLIEEIVGEIVDEHDDEEPLCEEMGDGSWRMAGRIGLDKVGEVFSSEFGDEPYETVGGLVFGLLGDVPKAGAVVRAHGLRFDVEGVSGRSIQAVRVAPITDVADAADGRDVPDAPGDSERPVD
ncbi:MAG: hemolysin family protein [Acidobacteriota bacterium]|nr:hemolysin family protein [Acidobacteriota bacterium]